MSIFAFKDLEVIRGKIECFLLVKSGVCEFEQFEHSLAGSQWAKQIPRLYGIIERFANLSMLPKEQFKDITPYGETIKEYEFKTKDLRAYGIKLDNGCVILCCGKKTTQDADIRHFRELKRQLLAA